MIDFRYWLGFHFFQRKPLCAYQIADSLSFTWYSSCSLDPLPIVRLFLLVGSNFAWLLKYNSLGTCPPMLHCYIIASNVQFIDCLKRCVNNGYFTLVIQLGLPSGSIMVPPYILGSWLASTSAKSAAFHVFSSWLYMLILFLVRSCIKGLIIENAMAKTFGAVSYNFVNTW